MEKPGKAPKLYFAPMSTSFLSCDPFSCVLSGARMVYIRAISGLTVLGLVAKAREIGLLRHVQS